MPAPTPAPTPTPTPTSTQAFDDEEFRASPWLAASNVLPAYAAGAFGQGAVIAVIDDGVDSSSAEFAGRILTGADGDSGGHGTLVAIVAAGARNAVGQHGVAFQASILSYNAQRCSPDCFIIIEQIAVAVDAAVSRGVRVINLSVIGGFSRPSLVAALRRATTAGVIVTIAAGNDGGPNPNGFALENAEQVDSPLLIIVGSHGADRQPTAVTSRAGSGAEWYLLAYSEGATSYSTPVVTGAVALLAGAFPSLTGAQIVDAIYAGAADGGTLGRDTIYGNGILDIGAAYARAKAMAGG